MSYYTSWVISFWGVAIKYLSLYPVVRIFYSSNNWILFYFVSFICKQISRLVFPF